MECTLDIQIPELLLPAELTLPETHLFERPELFLPATLDMPIARQDDLPQPIQLEVPQFGKRDIWPEAYEKMDAILSKLKFRERGIQ